MPEDTEECRIPRTDGPPPDDMDIGTKYLPDATAEEVERQAFWAYGFAHDIEDNPYRKDTSRYYLWRDAWLECEIDDEG